MSLTPLAVCDRPKGRHTLARLAVEDGRVMIQISIGLPIKTEHTSTGLILRAASWTSIPWDGEVAMSVDSHEFVILYCGQCKHAYTLNFPDLDISSAIRGVSKPIVLGRA